ncbi:protein kinase domain-containing protein [Nonomuraea sp. CA-141351]|uniref:protein kinase domain-containing protein n=1 Tax=Nonomuraea sp. CA-141351 TaxID=3239996 RepID=UPI003D89E6B1
MPPITELRAGDPAGLGGYEIRGRLGEGAQGVVYLGVDEQGRRAAVKWLRPELAGDGAAAERFAREVAAARRVAPFCTAKVLDTGVHQGRPYIVSEYVDGPTLERAVREEGARTGPALHRLAIGTATALAAIHQAGIVHRDFNPGNVLLGSEGPRVIGFGIATALDVASSSATVPVGASLSLAPEQLLGDPVGPAADMFAWASTIVFAAGGSGPFEAENVPATVQRVLNAEPDLARLSGTLRELAAACLSKDPARRPTAEQVIHRLLEHPAPIPDGLHQAAATVGDTSPSAPLTGGASPVGGVPSAGGAPPMGGGPSAGSGPQWQPPGADRPSGSGRQPWPGGQPYPQPSQIQYRPPGGGQPPPPTGRPVFEPPAAFHQPGTPPRPMPYGPPPRPHSNRKNWLIGGTIAGVALVAAITIVVVTVINLPSKKQALPTPLPTTTTTTTSPSPTVSPVPTANLTLVRLPGTAATFYESPDDPVRLTTYMVRDAKTKDWVYYARDSLTGSFTKYQDQWEAVLSPDGRYLAERGKNFIDHYDSVEITDKTTGEKFSIRTSQQPLSAYIQGWSRDSTRLLVNVGNPVKDVWQSTGFAIVDLTTRKATIASLREGSLKGIRYGFDGAGTGVVAMSNDTGQQALRFFDADGTRVRRIPNVGSGVADSLFSPSGKLFVTNCPGLTSGNNCVYDARSGAEVKRIESPCGGLATWFDDDHLVCWVRPDTTGDGQQIQVIDFTGKMVRLLADVPTGAADLDVIYTYRS